MAALEVASFETNFVRITGTSEDECGKAECVLAIGVYSRRQKSKLFGVTSSFKKNNYRHGIYNTCNLLEKNFDE